MAVILVFVGPSAIGKSFAAGTLIDLFPDHFSRVKVYTTRQKRSSEGRASDRVFISQEKFERMRHNGDFSVNEYFANNRYGLRKDDLEPVGRHLIVDAPPSWLPQLLRHKGVLVAGLQASPNYWNMLQARMTARGDHHQHIDARKPHIERDIQDLEKLSPIIHKHGKIFQIKDDRTVSYSVIPWVIEKLGLPKTLNPTNSKKDNGSI